jgi:hypothetical protein
VTTMDDIYRQSDRPILGDKGAFGFLPSLTFLSLGCLSQPLTKDFSTIPHLRVLEITKCPLAKDTLPCLIDDGAVLPDLRKLSIDRFTCRSMDKFEWRCKAVRPNLEIEIKPYRVQEYD